MISLHNVSFRYDNKTVFENISLNIEKGEKIGIIGESGCGKSTLLKIIAGLYKPTEGTVKVDGETEPANIIKKVSMVMQSPILMPHGYIY